MGLEPGIDGTAEDRVDDHMSAVELGSGDVRVLGTPALLALVERAACRAVEGRIKPGQTTVGASVELRHVAPTPVGAIVRAVARLTGVEGRNLSFEFEVTDPAGTIGTGTHGRVVVDRDRFLAAASART